MFEKHLTAHENKKMFPCDGCDQQFTQKANLMRHRQQHNGTTKRFKCRYCENLYYRKDQLNEHMMTHIKRVDMEFDCPVKQCELKFHNWHDLAGHVDIHLITPMNPGECKKCSRKYIKSRSLLIHFFADHNGDEVEVKGPLLKKRKMEVSLEKSDQSSEFLKNLLSFSNQIFGGQHPEASLSLSDTIEFPNMDPETTAKIMQLINPPEMNTPLSVETSRTPITGVNTTLSNTMEDTLLNMLLEVQKSNTSPVLSQANTTSPSLSPGSTSSDALSGAKQTVEDLSSSSTGTSATCESSPRAIELQSALGLPDLMSIFQQISQNPSLSPKSDVSEKSADLDARSSTSPSVDENEEPSRMEKFIHKCEPCGMLFDDLVMFKLHCTLHSVDTPFKCALCGFETDNKYGFLEHLVIAAHNLDID